MSAGLVSDLSLSNIPGAFQGYEIWGLLITYQFDEEVMLVSFSNSKCACESYE